MTNESKRPSKVSVAITNTRTWTSGTVRFAVLTVDGHPEKNYITLQKDLMGKPSNVGVQRFNMTLRDWNNLKRLIEVELPQQHHWVLESSGISLIDSRNTKELNKLMTQNPELIEKILDLPNLKLLSSESFESLSRLAIKIYQVQSKNIELVLKNLSMASPTEFVQFASLLKDLRLGQVATLVNLVRQKLEIIELFEQLITKPTTREKEIHGLIEENPWIANKSYEILASDRLLADFLNANVKEDPELKKRPDLIAKRVPNQDQIVLIELKRPEVKLRPSHIGQILEYKGLIQQFKPGTKVIDCYLFGYQKHPSFQVDSMDVSIRTFSELASALRDEYQTYLKVLEEDSRREEHFTEPVEPEQGEEDIPF